MQEDPRITATRQWVDDVVISHNFCPFAQFVRSPETIRYAVLEATAPKAVVKALEQECLTLESEAAISTTLVILARGYEDFFDYLALLDKANDMLDKTGYRGQFQLASFHPDYVFEGEAEDSPSHYTNRSPLPLFHLIRENDIERALSDYDDPESIPVNNIELTEQKGCAHFAQILERCKHTLKS